MGAIAEWWNSIRGIAPTDWIPEFELVQEESKRLYLKKIAIDTVLNFVSRIMSTARFKISGPESGMEGGWDYILNVRPNLDMSAAFFWQQVFYRLLFDNEVLIVFSDDNQMLIADGFVRREYALYEDVFEGVLVKDYCFQKSFRMSDVIYLEYNNRSLEEITRGLFQDYSELFGRMMEVAMRNNQIRGSVSVDATGSVKGNEEEGKTRSQKLQGFIDKVYESFRTNSVAIVPTMKGFSYEEYTNKTQVSNQSVNELTSVMKSLVDDISRIVGVPSALVHGELEKLEYSIKALRQVCTEPLVKKLKDELNAKIFDRKQYAAGNRLEVRGVLPYDIAEMAAQIDKLVASGAFYVDEVRNVLEYDDLPDGEGRKIIRTKNYEEAKGGEKE